MSNESKEIRVFHPSENTVKQATVSGMAAYDALYAEAEKDYEGFWSKDVYKRQAQPA